jgi:hypothetical protein
VAGKREAKVYPLHAGEGVYPGFDQYIPAIDRDLLNSASRWWTYGGMLRSVQLAARPGKTGGEMVKTFGGWSGSRTAASMQEIVLHGYEVREELGVRCVSGYGGAVRASLGGSLPVESRTHTAPYLEHLTGGWQQTFRAGAFTGQWKLYDLQSAYYAALLEGLPDPESYRCTRIILDDGLYRVKLAQPVPGAPYPYDFSTEVLATGEEIRRYALPVVDVIAGVAWTKGYNVSGIARACDRWTFAKRARRAFWGAWASSEAVTCNTAGKSWTPLRARPHPVWVHLILGRVRRKLWEAVSHRALHVYTDSILTQDTLTCGTSPGTWRLVHTYDKGVRVGRPGQYGPLGEAWERYAGVPIGDPRRAA